MRKFTRYYLKVSVRHAILVPLAAIAVGIPVRPSQGGEPTQRVAMPAEALSAAAKLRRTRADLGKIRSLLEHAVSTEVDGRSGAHAKRHRDGSQSAAKAKRFAAARLAKAARFLSRATPSSLATPRLVLAHGLLGLPRAGKPAVSQFLAISFYWLGQSPGPVGIAIFDRGRPRWKFELPKFLREYNADLSGFQYDYPNIISIDAAGPRAFSEGHGPSLRHWRSYPLHHRHWRRAFQRRLGEVVMPMPHGKGFWKFLAQRAGRGSIAVALTDHSKVATKPLRIPLQTFQGPAGRKPGQAKRSDASRKPNIPIPMAPNEAAWTKLQKIAYDHVWFHKPITVPHWQRKMAANYIELWLIPRLLPGTVDRRYRLNDLFRASPLFPKALARRLDESLASGKALPHAKEPIFDLGKYAKSVAAFWWAVRFLRHAPSGALRLPTIVWAGAATGAPISGSACICVSFLCNRRLHSRAFAVAVLRHGKVYLKISAPWSDASPNLPKSRFVARRKAKPSQFSAPALTPMPMPFPGPDYQALTIVRIRAAVTAAALRRRRPYTRRILLGTPVDKRFVDFLRARIGKTIGIGLMLNGRLMERTVRAAVTRGLGGAVGRIN